MNRIEEINLEIDALHKERDEIQEACTHPPIVVRYQYCSNTGNYDPSNDGYWTNYLCTLCEKQWSVEGSVRPGKGAKRVEHGDKL